MGHVLRLAQGNRRLLLKTASYSCLHVTVAALVAYAVTGSVSVALALSLLEPAVRTVAFFFHEKLWALEPGASAAAPSASAAS